LEVSVRGINLKVMSFDQLIDLRDNADRLIKQRATAEKRNLEDKLARLSKFAGEFAPGRRRSLKGRKIAPKYSNPENPSETWAGRGVRPRWLQALLKQGRALEEFAISKIPGARTKPAGRRGARRGARKKK
jgi:DNA-binding protein H-NS